MNFAIAADRDARRTDLLVIPYWKEKNRPKAATDVHIWNAELAVPLSKEDFKGNEGELLILYSRDLKVGRLALLGLGEKDRLTTETLRRAYASLTKSCNQRKLASI